jgi:hypothetical protein
MDDFKTMKEITDPVFAPVYKDEYERGFVEGRLSTVKSAVHRAVEGYGKMRELTDEEILESFAFYFGSTLNNKAYNDGAILFAKDILKKAQEK